MLCWIFGDVKDIEVLIHTSDTAEGVLHFEHARVKWFLSINENTIPAEVRAAGKRTFRKITIDGDAFEFSEGFTDLHTRSYEEILKGNGFGLEDTRKSIEIVSAIRNKNK